MLSKLVLSSPQFLADGAAADGRPPVGSFGDCQGRAHRSGVRATPATHFSLASLKTGLCFPAYSFFLAFRGMSAGFSSYWLFTAFDMDCVTHTQTRLASAQCCKGLEFNVARPLLQILLGSGTLIPEVLAYVRLLHFPTAICKCFGRRAGLKRGVDLFFALLSRLSVDV